MPHVNGKSGWWATVDDGTSWRRFGGLRGELRGFWGM